MNASESERSTADLPTTDGIPSAAPNRTQGQSKPESAASAVTARSKPLPLSRADWPLPPPISETADAAPATTRPKARPRHELIELSSADEKALEALQERCKEVGIKIKKNKLLTAGLQLLAAAPTGKLLALLGPLESVDASWKPKKKKTPPRA